MGCVNFYKCNPYKNTKCARRSCYMYGGKCWLTTNKYASVDEEELKEWEGWKRPSKLQYKIIEEGEFVGTEMRDLDNEIGDDENG